MSQRRRHPQRQVEGRRATLEWGKAGKFSHKARRLSRQLTHDLTRLGGDER